MASNPLTELIPRAYRKYVYVVAAAALFVYGLFEAASGDIRTFVISLLSALVSGLAASNTDVLGGGETPGALEDAEGWE